MDQTGLAADTHVVMMSSNGSIPVAVQAVKMGAFDFLKKPIPAEKLQKLAERDRPGASGQASCRSSRRRRRSDLDIDREIIGSSAAIERVKRMIRIAAKTDANVLIHGETGVGKDLIASVIHRQSHRQTAPYVKVGCTLLPPSLDRKRTVRPRGGVVHRCRPARSGRFEMAEGGTIYLDDVDDISLEQQAKLLRVIEEKVFERVGGTKLIKANVRIVASTKLNLLDKVAEGTFRQDLYYRLDVLRLRVPPLAQRLEDIPALTRASAGSASPATNRHAIDDDADRHALSPYLAGQCPRTVPHPGTGLAGGWRTHHCRIAAVRSGSEPDSEPANDRPGPTPTRPQQRASGPAVSRRRWTSPRSNCWSKRLTRQRRQQNGRRPVAGHEALHIPRQAGQARPALGLHHQADRSQQHPVCIPCC